MIRASYKKGIGWGTVSPRDMFLASIGASVDDGVQQILNIADIRMDKMETSISENSGSILIRIKAKSKDITSAQLKDIYSTIVNNVAPVPLTIKNNPKIEKTVRRKP